MSGEGVKYRPDIDGLRAIAVLSVVLYHFGIGGLQGGFVGVDVFFVISGYLITGIIHSELQRGEFTLTRFYERRARRIFPALFVVLLATMVAGLWILLPSDLARLGQSSVATILFVSNLVFYLQSGYFDPASEFNPLLHTWSLGVEEQFYLGLPLLMLMIGRYWKRGPAEVLAICALLSFIACVVVQSLNFKATFFLSPFRAWELLLGSLLGVGAFPVIRSAAMRNVLALMALGALTTSLAIMREGMDFPGWKVAIPVVATGVLLQVGASGGSRVNDALSWRPMVFVGLVSYSLYLWHWPVLVLAKYRGGMEQLSVGMTYGMLVLVFSLAIASYYAIERPFRKSSGGVKRHPLRVFALSGGVASLLTAAGAFLVQKDGLPGRVPQTVAEFDRARAPPIPYVECDEALPGGSDSCPIGEPGATRPLALVWGDSHAMAWAPGIDKELKYMGWRGKLAVNSTCAPLIGVRNAKDLDCDGYNDEVFDWVKKNRPDKVYLIAAWFAWSNTKGGYRLTDIPSGRQGNERIFGVAFGRTVESLRPYVKEVVVIATTPGAVDALPFKVAIAEWRNTPYPTGISIEAYRARNSNFWRGARRYDAYVTLIDPETWFCGETSCKYQDGSTLLYRDGTHLNLEGAIFAAGHLRATRDLPFAKVTVAAH